VFNPKGIEMHPDALLARQMAGNTTLRHAGPWRIVLAGRRVWLEHQSGRRIIDRDSIVATLQQRFHLDEDLARDVANGFIADAGALTRLEQSGA
jgi:predicted secreted protein